MHHTLLNGDKWTGVSIQTLDEKAFDHGAVLSQTPKESLAVPEDVSLPDLTAKLADVGAEMLVQSLRDGLYIPPSKDVATYAREGQELRHAPKLTKAEARMDWDIGASLDAEALERRLKGVVQVFGSVWTEAVDDFGRKKRVIFRDVDVVHQPSNEGQRKRKVMRIVEGSEREIVLEDGTGKCLVHWGGDVWVRIGRVTVQGSPEKEASAGLKAFMHKMKAD